MLYVDPIYSMRLRKVETFTAAAWVVSVSAQPGEETVSSSLMTSTDIAHPTTDVVFVSQVSAFCSCLYSFSLHILSPNVGSPYLDEKQTHSSSQVTCAVLTISAL